MARSVGFRGRGSSDGICWNPCWIIICIWNCWIHSRHVGMYFACRLRWWLDPQEQRYKGGPTRSKAAESQPGSGKGPIWVQNVCEFTLDKLPLPSASSHVGNGGLRGIEWERKGEESLALTGMESLVCLPSDLQSTPGSWPEHISSGVWGVVGLDCWRSAENFLTALNQYIC